MIINDKDTGSLQLFSFHVYIFAFFLFYKKCFKIKGPHLITNIQVAPVSRNISSPSPWSHA